MTLFWENSGFLHKKLFSKSKLLGVRVSSLFFMCPKTTMLMIKNDKVEVLSFARAQKDHNDQQNFPLNPITFLAVCWLYSLIPSLIFLKSAHFYSRNHNITTTRIESSSCRRFHFRSQSNGRELQPQIQNPLQTDLQSNKLIKKINK